MVHKFVEVHQFNLYFFFFEKSVYNLYYRSWFPPIPMHCRTQKNASFVYNQTSCSTFSLTQPLNVFYLAILKGNSFPETKWHFWILQARKLCLQILVTSMPYPLGSVSNLAFNTYMCIWCIACPTWIFFFMEQIAFAFVVYPCLVLQYMGQAAFLSKNLDSIPYSFYDSIPGQFKVKWIRFLDLSMHLWYIWMYQLALGSDYG